MNTKIQRQFEDFWTKNIGAKKTTLQSNVTCMEQIDCFRIKDTYIRFDSFPALDKGEIYCIETASLEDAQNNVFEDAWTYWSGDPLDEILSQMKIDLSGIYNS